MEILTKATEMFYSPKMKDFVFAQELDFVSYFDCYDTVTVDMAVSRQIPEADFRQAKRDLVQEQDAIIANWQKMVDFLSSLNEEADQQQASKPDPLEETQLPGVQLAESIEVPSAPVIEKAEAVEEVKPVAEPVK